MLIFLRISIPPFWAIVDAPKLDHQAARLLLLVEDPYFLRPGLHSKGSQTSGGLKLDAQKDPIQSKARPKSALKHTQERVSHEVSQGR